MFSAPVLDVNENNLEEIELDLGDIDPEIIAALDTGDEICFVPSRDIFLDDNIDEAFCLETNGQMETSNEAVKKRKRTTEDSSVVRSSHTSEFDKKTFSKKRSRGKKIFEDGDECGRANCRSGSAFYHKTG